jgi:hypothetical protein
MAQHDWIPSTLGHGETMCRNCSITNREAAVLGTLNECDAPSAKMTPEAVVLLEKWCGLFFGRNADGNHMDNDTYRNAHTKLFTETSDWLRANGWR